MRSENEARILYTVEKGIIFKGAHFEKIRRRATRSEFTFHYFSSASRDTAWPLPFKFASYAYGLSGIINQLYVQALGNRERTMNLLHVLCKVSCDKFVEILHTFKHSVYTLI